MKNALTIVMLMGVVLLGVACGVKATKEAPAGVIANEMMAEELVQALVDRDFEAARKDFDSTMQNAMSAEKLEEVWDQYGGNKGAFQSLGQTRIEYVKTFPCVFVTCIFADGEIVVQVTQDAYGRKATGLFFRPAGFSFL